MSTPADLTLCNHFYGVQHHRAPPPGATAMDLCTRDVVTSHADMTVAEAARRMRDRHVGALVVVEEVAPRRLRATGIVTDRDITTQVVACERDIHAYRVADIMSRHLTCARPGDAPEHLLATMHDKRVRRMPVTGPEGELLGIVTVDDLLACVAGQVQSLAAAVAAAQRHEV